MGCSASRTNTAAAVSVTTVTQATPKKRRATDSRFRGLVLSAAYERRGVAFLDRMDVQKLPYLSRRGLFLGFVRTRTWRIYLHFNDWPQPVTSAIVDRLIGQFRRAFALWMQRLLGFEGFVASTPKVKVFGFVFHRGVATAPSFDAKYRKYPVVREWTRDGEACPWSLQLGTGEPFYPQNFYRDDVELCDLRVVGNRTGTGAKFHPESWEGYVHPEGIAGFDTRYWHGATGWHAVAQQHYLRVGGVVKDYTTGDFADHFHVLQHEMGHCFFLDDMYDTVKYPRPLQTCDCALEAQDTIMHGAKALMPLDHAMLRHVWRKQSALAK